MLDLLEEDDDAQEVYHNAEFPEGWEECSRKYSVFNDLNRF
ncbi:hypothetical protein [Clostridium baratii]|nr:hypothetical protein [Clostridium baratii]MDU1053819.1 hypothetical protein [Clostridium baratii]